MKQIVKAVRNAPPPNRPVSLATLKNYLKIDGDEDNTELEAMLDTAIFRIEEYIEKKLITQSWSCFLNSFPTKRKTAAQNDWWDGTKDISEVGLSTEFLNYIELPFGGLQSVDEFFTYDDEGNEYQFDNNHFTLDKFSDFSRIVLKRGYTWPTTLLASTSGIKINCQFGYGEFNENDTESGNVNPVPAPIVQAVKQFTGILYEYRGDEQPKIPASVLMLLEPFRVFKLG